MIVKNLNAAFQGLHKVQYDISTDNPALPSATNGMLAINARNTNSISAIMAEKTTATIDSSDAEKRPSALMSSLLRLKYSFSSCNLRRLAGFNPERKALDTNSRNKQFAMSAANLE